MSAKLLEVVYFVIVRLIVVEGILCLAPARASDGNNVVL